MTTHKLTSHAQTYPQNRPHTAGNANLSRLCQSCAALIETAQSCERCKSSRTFDHPELTQLSIAHIDCDAFYASIEKRDRPELRHQPVIIGGGTRGVVSTACYIARVYGVHSAMPMFKAKKLCPHAVIVRPNMDKYVTEGRRIRAMMQELTPLVEPLSIDEAFLDLTGTQRLHGVAPVQSLVVLQNRINKEVGVTVSIGLSFNKFLAKTASDLDKPEGLSLIGRAEALDFLADKPVDFIFGVGPAFKRTLAKQGILTISDVRERSDKAMASTFGEAGLRLARLARAEDMRVVDPSSTRKSVSSETTFSQDISDVEMLKDQLWLMCLKTSDRAKALSLSGSVINLKLKTRQFETLTRRKAQRMPVQMAERLFSVLEPILEKEANGRAFRLLGVGITNLCEAQSEAEDLLEPDRARRQDVERATDIARQKFGSDAIMTGRSLRARTRKKTKDT